jgi:NAD+ synthase
MKDIDDEINRTCTFIKQHVSKTKSDGAIIALSGGLDSAVVAVLSTKALGTENVHCCFLRYKYASLELDKRHTDALCKKFGLSCEENRFVSKSTKSSCGSHVSKPSFSNQMIRQAANTVNTFIVNNKYLHMMFGNIDSIMRSGYLCKKAQEYNCLLMGTTNRSERLIGYFTKFDECECDLQPILHLYKTEIIEVAKHLDIPDEIINRIPSVDLWLRQTDEKELTCQKVDKILTELEKKRIAGQAYALNDATAKEVSKVIQMVKKAKQKHTDRFPPYLEFEGLYEQ